jgi:hypothetical protein
LCLKKDYSKVERIAISAIFFIRVIRGQNESSFSFVLFCDQKKNAGFTLRPFIF